MPRRPEVPKREILPDPKFGSVDLSKFMNVIMESGKKAVAEAIIYGALAQVEKLRDIAIDVHAHVNLIPYNTVEGLPWKRPSVTRQEKFADILRKARVSVTLRREKGHDIDAACGQLRLKTEKDRELAQAS